MLKIKGLYYETARQQLGPIDLTVDKGEIVGVVGKNGAGKSLLLKLVAQPGVKYDGSIVVNHYNVKNEEKRAVQQLGYVASSSKLEPYLTGIEYLDLVGIHYGLPADNRLTIALKIAEQFEIKKDLFSLIEQVSESVQQKIRLIAAFMITLPVILLDEPYMYLDQTGKNSLTDLLVIAKHAGSSILIASNDLDVVEKCADRIVVLNDGEICAEGTLTELHRLTRTKNKTLEHIILELSR